MLYHNMFGLSTTSLPSSTCLDLQTTYGALFPFPKTSVLLSSYAEVLPNHIRLSSLSFIDPPLILPTSALTVYPFLYLISSLVSTCVSSAQNYSLTRFCRPWIHQTTTPTHLHVHSADEEVKQALLLLLKHVASGVSNPHLLKRLPATFKSTSP